VRRRRVAVAGRGWPVCRRRIPVHGRWAVGPRRRLVAVGGRWRTAVAGGRRGISVGWRRRPVAGRRRPVRIAGRGRDVGCYSCAVAVRGCVSGPSAVILSRRLGAPVAAGWGVAIASWRRITSGRMASWQWAAGARRGIARTQWRVRRHSHRPGTAPWLALGLASPAHNPHPAPAACPPGAVAPDWP